MLAAAGLGSRRVCEEMIEAGRVEVNGEVARIGRRVDPTSDHVRVDGVPIATAPGLVYYLLNKPAGVVCSASDPQGRPTVVDLVPAEPRVYPVGRLDAPTEGLLVLTNDGELAYRLTHPSFGVEKEYLVHVHGRPDNAALRRLRDGVELDDGRTAPARVSRVAPDAIRLTIHEGRNRQVRRMTEAVGHPVIRLVRTRIGPLRGDGLRPGQWRPLNVAEVRGLERAVSASNTLAPRARPRPPAPRKPPRKPVP